MYGQEDGGIVRGGPSPAEDLGLAAVEDLGKALLLIFSLESHTQTPATLDISPVQ